MFEYRRDSLSEKIYYGSNLILEWTLPSRIVFHHLDNAVIPYIESLEKAFSGDRPREKILKRILFFLSKIVSS